MLSTAMVDDVTATAPKLAAMAARPTKNHDGPDALEAIAAMRKERAGGRGRRSPLYLWLRANHDQLAREFETAGPAWDALAAFLGTRGVLDGRGQKPTGRGVRAVWFRVRAEVKAAGEKKPAQPILGVQLAPQTKPSAPAPHGCDQAKPVRSPQTEADPPPPDPLEAPPRPKFGPSRLRNNTASDAGQRGESVSPEPSKGKP